LWQVVEGAAWGIGLLCVVTASVVYIDGSVGKAREMRRFAERQRAALQQPNPPDLSLWSPERIAAWRNVTKDEGPAPLAILRIPRIHLEVPVIEGTDDVALNRALGHIEDTAIPGADGNSGIAGHRDGFFRGLKDIVAGDVIELETLHSTEIYRIERMWIVDPEDVSVLDPTPTRSLTLVTCYPFYYVGSAPKRYIVRAVIATAASASARPRR
jgi:sortase A